MRGGQSLKLCDWVKMIQDGACGVQVQQQCGRELCIVVTNLSRMCSEYCTTDTCPDLPIRAAVRMSMAFPGPLLAIHCCRAV